MRLNAFRSRRNASSGVSSPLRAILVGCGGISQAWLDAARRIEGLEIAGLADLNLETAKRCAEKHGLGAVPADTDFRSILAAVRPDIVFDCAVPEAHAEITIEALERGCHVLGEKPMADTIENARRMVAASARTGRLFAVIQNRRYAPAIRRLRAFLDSGALGRIGIVNSDFYIGAHFGGFRDEMKHVLLADMAIHTFDAARFLSGKDPVSVTCREWNPPGSWYAHGASANALFEMSGGLFYAYRGSWCAEGLNTSWECNWRFTGEKGSAVWDGGENARAEVVAERGGFHSKVEPVDIAPAAPEEKTEGHLGLIREFVACVRQGRKPETVCTDNIRSFAMACAAIESAEKGRTVKVRW